MDNKRLIQIMLFISIGMLGYYFIFSPAKPAAPAPVTPAIVAATTSGPATGPGAIVAAGAPAPVVETRELGSAAPDNPAKLHIVISNAGAGIDLVQLNARDYTATAKSKDPFTLMRAEPEAAKPFASLQARVNDVTYNLQNKIWRFVENPPPNEVRLEFNLYDVDGKTILVSLTKIFHLDPDTYDVTITHVVTNLSDKKLAVAIDQLGPANLNYDSVASDPRIFQVAVLKPTGTVKYISADRGVSHDAVADGGPKTLGSFRATGNTERLAWVAASDRFFTMILRPSSDAQTRVSNPEMTPDTTPETKLNIPDYADDVTAMVLGERTVPNLAKPWRTVGLKLAGAGLMLDPKATTDMPLSVYMGPKRRDLLAGSATAPVNSPAFTYHLYSYSSVIQLGSLMCSFLTWDFLANFILWLLNVIHSYITFGNYGAAIILLVIVVRLLLHPLTRHSQVSMAVMQKKMGAIKGDIDRVKKKYAKDKTQQQQELLKVYKDNNVNPAGGIMGCLPMFLQMPIWLALYAGLAVDIDLRHAAFIPGWINDLSNPDTVASWTTSYHIPIIGQTIGTTNSVALNILPLLLAVVFFVQMKVQQRTMPKPADEQQAQTQKMTQYMSLIFPIILYNMPSGLNLYIFASTSGGIFDTWLVRRHMREKGLLPAASTPPTM